MPSSKILIVDDEENILSALKRLFRRENYQIFTAESGEEGLKILDEHEVDLIISDLKMPSMNGVEFLTKAKQKNSDALRIMLTGHADLKSVIDAIDQGEVYRFLLKPWNNEELKMTIKQALDFYYVQKENKVLARTVKRQNKVLEKLEKEHPGITTVNKDQDGTILLDVEEVIQKYEDKKT
ncbi:MAG: response regulator [candidate division Zixibacteria bacterium]|nr:response regulator [candidate division Zixibacteria bacterium]